MTTVRVYARDAGGTLLGEIDDFASLSYTKRHNTYGSWQLDTTPTSRVAALLDMQGGIIVTIDGAPEFSGRVLSMQRSSTDRDSLDIAGADDLYWLHRRLARPVPAGPPYTAAEHDVRSGVAETVIREYVDVNAGPGALPQYRVPGLTLAPDLARGAAVEGRARFPNLLEFVAGLATSGGLGVRIAQVGAALEFQVYEPADLTGTIVFSRALGNLREFSYGQVAPVTNYVIAAGGGEGVARAFQEHGDNASIAAFGRFEDFIDQRQTTDTSELDQAIDRELETQREKSSLKITPLDTPGRVYGANYGLGDRVTVTIDGQVISDVIREVEVEITPDGVEVRPLIGDERAAARALAGLLRAQRSAAQRLANLERGT